MRPSPGYPEARERPSGQAAGSPDRYARYESKEATLADSDTPVELGVFSGRPDAVDLIASGGAVRFTLTDEFLSEESSIVVNSGSSAETRISRRVVRAVRVTAATTPFAQAVAKWLG